MNMALMEMVRSVLDGVGIKHKLWPKIVSTTCYLINQSPTSTLVDKTPRDACIGKKPFLEHLRVFCCDDYVHVLEEKKRKLDNEIEKYMFIGYKDGVRRLQTLESNNKDD
jgi:hypothetical protein